MFFRAVRGEKDSFPVPNLKNCNVYLNTRKVECAEPHYGKFPTFVITEFEWEFREISRLLQNVFFPKF